MEGRRPALSCVAARVPRRKVSVQKVEKTLICLGIALVVGLLMSRLAKLVHLPAVTAYLVGGLLIGPFCLGALNIPYIGFNSLEQVEGLSVITQTALGFIAFAIGNEFRVSQLKTMGKQAITVGILQAVITTIVVDIIVMIGYATLAQRIALWIKGPKQMKALNKIFGSLFMLVGALLASARHA